MSLPPLIRAALLAVVLAALAAASATGALVEVNDLVLHADGGFQPRSLPRHRFVPIGFQGHFEIAAKGGGKPSPLRQVVIDFDRDGRLSVAGLPTCDPEAIDDEGTEEARRTCKGAIVGTGEVEALVSLPEGTVPASSPLTVFNGPQIGGHPTVVLHARTTVPATQIYAILVPIERRPGRFRYRVTLDLPPIAAGHGAITHLGVQIRRRYRAGGRQRSYVSARCSDNILETHGRFSFEDGTIIDGSVEKYCHAS
ncbi:MAG TPA: hypothetical protein VNB59_00605 [Solirubrobacterales bacterium]|jgi:hypothetical protein|nr:hypothetical protein [Solirubrobacterales bacterium]